MDGVRIYTNYIERTLTIPTEFAGHSIILQSANTPISSVTLDIEIVFAEGLIKKNNDLTERVSGIEYNYIPTFERIAVIGDSYSSGAIFSVDGVTDGRHDGVSWLKIMARQNGVQGKLYSIPGINCKKWLIDTSVYGLSQMLTDTPSNLYFIFLGINEETTGTVEDCHEDWTDNADTFYGNYGKIIGNIKTHAPNAKIVCIAFHYISAEKNIAIRQIAKFYGVAVLEAENEPYFSSKVYSDGFAYGHPVAVTYAGMASAFQRCFAKCVENNITYFKSYQGND